MKLILIGINHRTANIDVREKFSFTKRRLEESLKELKNSLLFSGAVILSTCNRSEIYAHIKENCSADEIDTFIFNIFRAQKNDIGSYFYSMEDVDAKRHLIRVAAGLDSQVLGETQILAQLKSAWVTARTLGTTSDFIDRIFEAAYQTGRIVRLQTDISYGNVSIGSVAMKTLEERFGKLEDMSVLIIGAGKIGVLISKYLRDKMIKGIFVANRSYDKALELASNCGGKAVNFTELKEELRSVDIVISSTSSPHIILKKEELISLMQVRRKPLFIMDLALPRDVDPRARDIPGISLCDLDDLKGVVEASYKKREAASLIAEKIVQRELDNFLFNEKEIFNRRTEIPMVLGPSF